MLVAVGVSLSGFLPWLMVCWALDSRGRRRLAAGAFVANAVLFGLTMWASLRSVLPWWWILSLCHLLNLVWSLAAWHFQRRTLGAAPRRYRIGEWRGWLIPLTIGAALGVCAAVTLSLPAAFAQRAALQATEDALDRQSVLWGAFDHLSLALVAGALLGLWWAGEGRRFRTSHVVSFLSALVVTMSGTAILVLLLMFILHGGSGLTGRGASESILVPAWTSGFRRVLRIVEDWDVSAPLIIPLLFGAPSRIRDFAKRALLVPLAFACALPLAFSGISWWDSLQDQIVYEMSSPDAGRRASAHDWCEILLRRFPGQARWPMLAERIARYRYESGEIDEARALYREIVDRFGESNEWSLVVSTARGVPEAATFWRPVRGPTIEIPMVDYESYLTSNWMVLLSAIRYWEGANVPESEVKIRLKALSQSDDKILLGPLTNLAELDDAVRNLGYEVFILPTDSSKAKALVSAGIPVILQSYGSFELVFGFDDSRSVMRAYSFSLLSERLMQDARREAKEILAMEEEGRGQSRERLGRIRNEAYFESGPAIWQPAQLRFASPLMAVVCPENEAEHVSRTVGLSHQELERDSNGLLAALMAFSFLDHGDPVKAAEWARLASRNTAHPLPLYVGHLAQRLWSSRERAVKSRIPLQDEFPQLRKLALFFESTANADFFERSRERFDSDRAVGALPWFIANKDLSLLDRSDVRDLKIMIQAMRTRVRLEPGRQPYWTALADACEWAGDLACRVDALEGAVSAGAMDSLTKLRLAYTHVLRDQPAEAQKLLNVLDVEKVRYEADYHFCLGAVAEWEQDSAAAIREYEQAIAMRTYRAVYHLKLGALLIKQGKAPAARRALEWAAKIDAEGRIAEEATRLLGATGKTR